MIYTFKAFDIIWVMTRGGPGYSTEILATQLYKNAFTNQQYGYSSVIAVVMVVISSIFAILYARFAGYTGRKKL